jgi:hypothetical protein
MTLTTKPLNTTLSVAEQIELRRMMKNPECQHGVSHTEPVRKMLVESLAKKGYLEKVATHAGFDYYRIKAE